MHKDLFIQELINETNYNKAECEKIYQIIEEKTIVGKNNKIKMMEAFEETLKIDEPAADELYNTVAGIIMKAIGNKLKHPFSK